MVGDSPLLLWNSFPTLAGLSDFAQLVGAIAASLATIQLLQRMYVRTLGRRWDNYRRLARLGTNAQLSFFNAVLGEPPAITRSVKPKASRIAHRSLFKERIWIDRDFFVQAVTDDDETVVRYSVTSRKKWFRPKLRSPGYHYLGPRSGFLRKLGFRDRMKPIFDVRLSATNFAELEPPQKVSAWLGARRFHYSEEHWLGNPGNYQTYLFSINDSGFLGSDFSALNALIEGTPMRSPSRDWVFETGTSEWEAVPGLREFRQASTMNTYTVIGPNHQVDTVAVTIGVDGDVVRTLL